MKKPIILYGAGPQNLRIPYETLPPAGYEILYICDRDEEKWGKTVYGYEIISPEKLREFDRRGESYYLIITVRNRKTVSEIKAACEDLEHAEIWTFQNFFYENRIHSSMERLPVIIVHLADHCDLNCVRCSHYSSLAEPRFLDIEEFEKEFYRLWQLVGDNIAEIQLLGGEPLLHPQIEQFFYSVRKYFHKSIITLITNGIRLLKMEDSFYRALSENHIVVSISYYGVNLDYVTIEKKMMEYGIEYVIGNEGDYKSQKPKTMEKDFPLVPSGGMNGEENFRKCFLSTPKPLEHGYICNCTPAAYVEHFNRYFGTDVPDIKQNGVNLFELQSGKELIEKLKQRPAMCDYCSIPDELDEVPWSRTRREISEWVDMKKYRGGGYLKRPNILHFHKQLHNDTARKAA